jgi:hypothetical protein
LASRASIGEPQTGDDEQQVDGGGELAVRETLEDGETAAGPEQATGTKVHAAEASPGPAIAGAANWTIRREITCMIKLKD